MAINFIMLPSLRRVSLPYDRVAVWSRLYDIGSKIMGILSGVVVLHSASPRTMLPTIISRIL